MLPPSSQPVTISVTFARPSYSIDAAQTESVTAFVTNDGTNAGVKWTVTCPAGVAVCGFMTNAVSKSGAANIYSASNVVGSAEVVTITATSVAESTKSAAEQLTVNPQLALVSPAPLVSAAQIGVPYSLGLTNFVQGGTAPLSWAIASGALPSGLVLQSAMIGGTPMGPTGSVSVNLTARDASKPAMSVNVSLSLTVTPAPQLSITPGSPPNGTVGAAYGWRLLNCSLSPYGWRLNASGGVEPYSWSWVPASGSSLPPGLYIASESTQLCWFFGGLRHYALYPARISGTPTVAGTYQVVVLVSDSESPEQQATVNYTIVIAP
jgi:hypothetical protein